jgi:nitroreductase
MTAHTTPPAPAPTAPALTDAAPSPTEPVSTAQVRHVVEAATRAPSVHNTQPWRFVVLPDGFELHADRSRQLPVLDPSGRQLHISCGAALATATVAARELQLDAVLHLLPDPASPDLLARVHLAPGRPATADEATRAAAVQERHTVRGVFGDEPLPSGLLDRLGRTAEAEGAMLRHVREDELVELAVLLSGADAAEEQDPAYRDELAAWVRDSGHGDGLPTSAVESPAGRGSSLRLRDFTLSASERSSGAAPPAERPDVVVLSTQDDAPAAWLRAGRALGLLLLDAAAAGVQAQPLGQVTDLPGPRHRLAAVLGLRGVPQLVLRLGVVSARGSTPRRPVDEVVGLPGAHGSAEAVSAARLADSAP